MAPSDFNFTQAAANVVVPTSGNNYQISNLGFGHWLNNAFAGLADGNPILSWRQADGFTNQIWTYLTYPSSDGSTVFTLQSLATLESASGAVIDGRGGYVRVDSNTNKIVHGGQPQAWKLIEVAPSVYKIGPFENVFSSNGELVMTDVNSAIIDPATNQARLSQDTNALQQFWTFN